MLRRTSETLRERIGVGSLGLCDLRSIPEGPEHPVRLWSRAKR